MEKVYDEKLLTALKKRAYGFYFREKNTDTEEEDKTVNFVYGGKLFFRSGFVKLAFLTSGQVGMFFAKCNKTVPAEVRCTFVGVRFVRAKEGVKYKKFKVKKSTAALQQSFFN